MRCDTYAPNPNCHTGQPEASSTHDTAFTGGELAAPSIWLALTLFAGALCLGLARLFKRARA